VKQTFSIFSSEDGVIFLNKILCKLLRNYTEGDHNEYEEQYEIILRVNSLGGVMVTWLPLNPKSAGSNPAEAMDFKWI
jgi:hypothetical protein